MKALGAGDMRLRNPAHGNREFVPARSDGTWEYMGSYPRLKVRTLPCRPRFEALTNRRHALAAVADTLQYYLAAEDNGIFGAIAWKSCMIQGDDTQRLTTGRCDRNANEWKLKSSSVWTAAPPLGRRHPVLWLLPRNSMQVLARPMHGHRLPACPDRSHTYYPTSQRALSATNSPKQQPTTRLSLDARRSISTDSGFHISHSAQ
ncbi:hypothetical protein VTK26DRAFT_8371 [Humicola hyalothermophila]